MRSPRLSALGGSSRRRSSRVRLPRLRLRARRLPGRDARRRRTSRRARACATYPVQEQAPFVWIWLGDPGAAALRLPPETPWWRRSRNGRARARPCTSTRTTCSCTSITSTSRTCSSCIRRQCRRVSSRCRRSTRSKCPRRSVAYSRETALAAGSPTGRPRRPAYPPTRECTRREEGTFRFPGAARPALRRSNAEAAGRSSFCGSRASRPNLPTATHVFLQIARNYATDH